MPQIEISAPDSNTAVDAGTIPGTNGKLTPELFDSVGIVVTNTAKTAAVTSKVGPNQPSKVSKAEIIRLGEEAMERLAKGQTWEDWIWVMRVLDIARLTAMLEAKSNKPQGPRYREAIRKWFRLYPVFASIDKADRNRFHRCFDNLDAINDWRKKHVPDHRLLKLNYPPTVLKRWESWKKKKQAEPRKEGADDPDPDRPSGPKLADIWLVASEKEKQEILDHEGRVGLAKLVSRSLLTDLVDHAVAQQIASGPNTKLKTYVDGVLTKIFLAIIGDLKEKDIDTLSNAEAGFLRKYRAFNCDHQDLQIRSLKRAPKKR